MAADKASGTLKAGNLGADQLPRNTPPIGTLLIASRKTPGPAAGSPLAKPEKGEQGQRRDVAPPGESGLSTHPRTQPDIVPIPTRFNAVRVSIDVRDGLLTVT
jgi:hypothetical protein